MIRGTLSAAALAVNGRLNGGDAPFAGVSTDSRNISAGELFVALSGPNFDGTTFVADAVAKGAAGVIVSSPVNVDAAQIHVDDTRSALRDLARDWRRQLSVRVIALTGSNGKTTVKEMLASCLSQVAETLATEGNLNNEIGVPLTLFRLAPEHRYAVIEMGANHEGEIARLTATAEPEVVMLTNAGNAHLEGFGGIEGVARGKGEILSGEPRPRAAILNADDRYFDYWSGLASDTTVISFGDSAEANVRVTRVELETNGMLVALLLGDETLEFHLPLVGEHNARNAAAAAAAAAAVGVASTAIAEGLQRVRPVQGRLTPQVGRLGMRVFDDSYNANPDSVSAAARYIGAETGTSWLILGSMFELGDDATQLHAEVGRVARKAGVARLFGAGPHAKALAQGFGEHAEAYDDVATLNDALDVALATAPPDNILVKGSRSMRMEQVVRRLVDVTNGEAA